MSTLRRLNISLGLDTKDLEEKMARVSRNLRRSGRDWGRLGSEMTAALTLPLAGISAGALKAAADYEKFQTSFNVLLGDAEKGKALFADLKEFAAKTPFQLGDISDAGRQLLAFGFNVDQAKDGLQFMGDIAASTNSRLSDLTMILGQAKAIGAAYTQDLRQLANRGIPVFDLLKEKFQVSGEELAKMVSDGKISFEVLQEVLKDTTKEGGMFFGGMEKQSRTLAGQFSTFKDNVQNSLASLGVSISEAFDLKEKMANASKWLERVAKQFDQLDDKTKENIITAGLFVAAAGPVIKTYGMLNNAAAGAVDMAKSGVKAYRALSGAVVNAATKFAAMDKVMKATTVGLVLAGVAGLVVVIDQLNKKMSTAQIIQSKLAGVQQTAEKNIIAERLAAEKLVKTINDETASKIEKKKAIDELNRISPTYFNGLDGEKVSVEKVNEAYDRYVANLLRSAKLKARQEELIALEEKRLDLVNKIERHQQVADQNSGKFMSSAFGAAVSVENLRKELEGVNEQIKAIGSQGDGLMSRLFKGFDLGMPDAPKIDNKNNSGKNAMAEATQKVREQLELASLSSSKFQVVSMAVNEEMQLGVTVADEMANSLMSVQEMFERLQDSGTGMATVLGAALQNVWSEVENGEHSFEKLGQAALKAAAKQLRGIIMTGVAQAVQGALTKVPFPFNLAAGALAGAAAGALFNKALSGLRIPALAEGAVVNKPTLALIGEAGPEIVAPPKKLPGLATMMGIERRSGGRGFIAETRIKRGDLYIAVREAMQDEARRSGKPFNLT